MIFDLSSVNTPQKYKKIQKLANFRAGICKICAYPGNFVPLQPKKTRIMKNVIIIAAILAGSLAIAAILSSCNVTRTITNESQYFQRGDTSVVIQTKTIETYDATRKL